MEIKNLKIWQTNNSFIESSLMIENGLFSNSSSDNKVIDGKNAYAIPGLIDLHFHGAVGHDISDGSKEALEAIAKYEISQGITGICPASMALPKIDLLKVMEVIKEGMLESASSPQSTNFSNHSRLWGLHLEGPFFSKEKKGAQNADYLKAPDIAFYNALQEASHNGIKIVSLAPELENALEFAKEIQKNQDEVILSVAHTNADYECVAEALKVGFRHFTHLYNGMTGFTHRKPGVVGAALECEGNHTVELICDGIHLHPAAVRLAFKVLGNERIIFISDSMRAVGLSDGTYDLGGQEVNVKGNLASLKDGTIAGSATNLFDCLKVAVKEVGIPLENAIACASLNPAKKLGIDSKVGSLDKGKYADFLLIDEDMNLLAVYKNGEKVISF